MRPAPRRPLVTLLTVLGGVTALAAPASAQVVLPPTQAAAEQVVNQYIQANTHNNNTLDVEGQAAIEDAPIKPIDDALFREYRGRGKTTLAENVTNDSVKVFRPDQSSYPLSFLALQRSHDPNAKVRQYLLFGKASAADPWKVSMAAQLLDRAATPKLKVDSDGFAKVVTDQAAAALVVKPTELAPKLAKVWDKSLNGVPTSKDFEPGVLTTDVSATFVGELQQLPLSQAKVDFKFTPGENRPSCFATSRGGALCLFVVTIRETLKPASGSFVQPPTREPLTGLIAPGSYKEVHFDRTAILVAAVPKRGKLARADVIGIYEGLTHADAIPGAADQPGTSV